LDDDEEPDERTPDFLGLGSWSIAELSEERSPKKPESGAFGGARQTSGGVKAASASAF